MILAFNIHVENTHAHISLAAKITQTHRMKTCPIADAERSRYDLLQVAQDHVRPLGFDEVAVTVVDPLPGRVELALEGSPERREGGHRHRSGTGVELSVGT